MHSQNNLVSRAAGFGKLALSAVDMFKSSARPSRLQNERLIRTQTCASSSPTPGDSTFCLLSQNDMLDAGRPRIKQPLHASARKCAAESDTSNCGGQCGFSHPQHMVHDSCTSVARCCSPWCNAQHLGQARSPTQKFKTAKNIVLPCGENDLSADCSYAQHLLHGCIYYFSFSLTALHCGCDVPATRPVLVDG